MSGTQPVTGSDGSHPPVPVKLSEPEQQRVQQADAKLQDYMKHKQSKVRSSTTAGKLRFIEVQVNFYLLVIYRMCLTSLSRHPQQLYREKDIYEVLPGASSPASSSSTSMQPWSPGRSRCTALGSVLAKEHA